MTLDEINTAHQSLIKLQSFYYPTISHDYQAQKTFMFVSSYMQDVLQQARVAATTLTGATVAPATN